MECLTISNMDYHASTAATDFGWDELKQLFRVLHVLQCMHNAHIHRPDIYSVMFTASTSPEVNLAWECLRQQCNHDTHVVYDKLIRRSRNMLVTAGTIEVVSNMLTMMEPLNEDHIPRERFVGQFEMSRIIPPKTISFLRGQGIIFSGVGKITESGLYKFQFI